MKHFVLLIATLLLNLTVLCQQLTLKPVIIKQDTTEFRCFKPDQYKYIVKSVVSEIYNDSILSLNQQTLIIQDSLIRVMKIKRDILRSMVDNQSQQINMQNVLLNSLRQDLEISQYNSKKYRRQRNWLIGGLGAAVVGIIVK